MDEIAGVKLLKKPISKGRLQTALKRRKLDFDISAIENGSRILGYEIDVSNPNLDEQKLSVVPLSSTGEGPFLSDIYMGPRFSNAIRKAALEGRGPDWLQDAGWEMPAPWKRLITIQGPFPKEELPQRLRSEGLTAGYHFSDIPDDDIIDSVSAQWAGESWVLSVGNHSPPTC